MVGIAKFASLTPNLSYQVCLKTVSSGLNRHLENAHPDLAVGLFQIGDSRLDYSLG
jgi:hypothetical protein